MRIIATLLLLAAAACAAENVVVFRESGRFGGWPANNGIWSWGDEIVVGATTAERILGFFVLENLGEKSFKNVSQPLRVYRIIPPGVYDKIA